MMMGMGAVLKCFPHASRNTLKSTFSFGQGIKDIQYLLLELPSTSVPFPTTASCFKCAAKGRRSFCVAAMNCPTHANYCACFIESE